MMARSSKAPSIGRIQKRKTNFSKSSFSTCNARPVQTCAAHGSCPPRAKCGSHFKVCWAGKLVIGDHVTGFLIIAAVGAASGLIQISSARPSRPLCAQRRI
jgi:hypothetical protein